MTLIAFVGSVFSPYYALARRGGRAADPLRHNAVNVALYGERGGHWAMTERGDGRLQRDAQTLQIGPSRLAWERGDLCIEVDEVTAPWPARLRGRIEVRIDTRVQAGIALDAAGRHHWSPIAPRACVEVAFERPRLRWHGTAYLDSNRGSAPLEDDFVRWHWSRAALPDGRSVVLYDVERRAGHDPLSVALCFGADGQAEPIVTPAGAVLPRSAWRVERATRADAGTSPRVLSTLEDGPFYVRSLLEAQLLGHPVHAVHESLSLDRFAAPWVQAMLPFRMPRRA